MPVTAIVGTQWGDEGKGRIIDLLAQQADVVIRFQGGSNAGHTVVNDRGKFALHLVPSGIFNPQTRCIVGAGAVVEVASLLDEMAQLEAAGVSLQNLWLSERAHITLPLHRQLDGLEEGSRGAQAIGTTKRGVGPTYEDKAARRGLRLADLRHPEHLAARVKSLVAHHNPTLAAYGQPLADVDDVLALLAEWQRVLGARIIDTLPMTQAAVRGGQQVLLEGQLGVMRDLDWGTYPFVTSSNPCAGAACAGAGLPPSAVTSVIGVTKVYTTAVGAGPFPTELHDETGAKLRAIGHEYGATTGRPRRCGWFDAPAVRLAAWLNGLTGLALTKLDVLDTFEELWICTGYTLDGRALEMPPESTDYGRVVPVYEQMPGWMSSTRGIRRWEDLPEAAKRYLTRLSEVVGVAVHSVSVGPERDEIILL